MKKKIVRKQRLKTAQRGRIAFIFCWMISLEVSGVVRSASRDRRVRSEWMAFAEIAALRVAVDQELADFDAPLDGVREVAFFPPMTGG